jgi:hypothetical protein
MGTVVNLNKYRKKKAKADREKRADQNRRLHGRTTAERTRDELAKQRLERAVDGARLDGAKRTEADAELPPASKQIDTSYDDGDGERPRQE